MFACAVPFFLGGGVSVRHALMCVSVCDIELSFKKALRYTCVLSNGGADSSRTSLGGRLNLKFFSWFLDRIVRTSLGGRLNLWFFSWFLNKVKCSKTTWFGPWTVFHFAVSQPLDFPVATHTHFIP